MENGAVYTSKSGSMVAGKVDPAVLQICVMVLIDAFTYIFKSSPALQ